MAWTTRWGGDDLQVLEGVDVLSARTICSILLRPLFTDAGNLTSLTIGLS